MKKIILLGLVILFQNIELKADTTISHNYKSYTFGEFLTQVNNDTTNRLKLLNMVKAKGQIKIWVYHDIHYISEESLNSSEIFKQRSDIEKRHAELIKELESNSFFSKVNYKSKKRPVLSLVVDEDALKFLFKAKKIMKISIVERATVNVKQSTSIIGANKTWDLNFSGQGEVIVIIDTGVDSEHDMLDGKVIDGLCYSSNVGQDITSTCVGGLEFDFGSLSAEECGNNIYGCDHGTHVAGITVGKSSTSEGVAPEADIISVKVFSSIDDPSSCDDIDDDGIGDAPCAQAFMDDIIQALEYIYDVFYMQNYYNIAAINMSLGQGEFSSICDDTVIGMLYQDAVSDLFGVNIPIIAASGNEHQTDKLSAPAC